MNNRGLQTQDIARLMPRDVDEVRIRKDLGFYGTTKPVTHVIFGTSAATFGNYTAPFFIANRSYLVIRIDERHETAGTDGSDVTLQVKKVPNGTAPASGTNLIATALSLKATANTNQNATLVDTPGVRTLVLGDALSLVPTGTLTSVAGVTVSVLLRAI